MLATLLCGPSSCVGQVATLLHAPHRLLPGVVGSPPPDPHLKIRVVKVEAEPFCGLSRRVDPVVF